MKAVCYYNHFGFDSPPNSIFERWIDSFSKNGFEPVILNESDAREHPLFDKVNELISKLPTVNNPEYERACWLRWLAYRQLAPAFFTDIDVINYGFKPDDVQTQLPMYSHYTYASPAAVYATGDAIDSFIDNFSKARFWINPVNGVDHVSDMIAFHRCYGGIFSGHCCDSCYPDAMTFPLVHFGNSSVPREWAFNKRYLAIDDLSKRRRKYEIESK